MLIFELMAEASRRYGSGPSWAAVVGDAGDQARHHMDAPDTVQDGMRWLDEGPDFSGPVPRTVPLREPPDATAPLSIDSGGQDEDWADEDEGRCADCGLLHDECECHVGEECDFE